MNLTPSGNKSPTVTLNDLSGPLLTTTIVYSIISLSLIHIFDINPSIELGVNRFNRVVSGEGYNADGVKLAGELSLQYADYMDALDQVLANDTVAALLDADGVLTITVVGPAGEQTTNMPVSYTHLRHKIALL